MKTLVLCTAVTLFLAAVLVSQSAAECEDQEPCDCPSGDSGICVDNTCQLCGQEEDSRVKRAMYIGSRCYRPSQCGSTCRCVGAYRGRPGNCCCPWHGCYRG